MKYSNISFPVVPHRWTEELGGFVNATVTVPTLPAEFAVPYTQVYPNGPPRRFDRGAVNESCAHLQPHAEVLEKLRSNPVSMWEQLDMGGVNYKLKLVLDGGVRTVFRFFRCPAYTPYNNPLRACTNWVSEVLAFHVNAVLGYDHVPPAIARPLPVSILCNATLSKPCHRLDYKRQCTSFRSICNGDKRIERNPHFVGSSRNQIFETPEDPNPPDNDTITGGLQLLWRSVLKVKRHIQIGPYDFEGRPAVWCLQTHSSQAPPIDKRLDWSLSSETIIFSYLTNNWDRLFSGANDLFIRRPKPNFIWLDNGNAFSTLGTDPTSGARTLQMLCHACKFAKRMITALREAGPLGQRVKYSVERCAKEDGLTLFRGMTPDVMDEVYENITRRQEYVLAEVDRCVAKYGEKAVLSI